MSKIFCLTLCNLWLTINLISAQCTPQPAPYLQNFDYLSSLPQCTYSNNATILVGGRTGNLLSLTSTPTTNSYIIFPELQIPSDSVEISSYIRSATYRSKAFSFTLGFVTDTSDIYSSFLPLITDSVYTNDWVEYRFITYGNPYPTLATSRLAILVPSGMNANLYIDDIDIHHTPTCFRPENLSFPRKTSTSFDISWTGSSSARIDVTDFASTVSHYVTTNPATISNLSPYTPYTVTVTAICAPGDTSATSLPASVTTHPNCPHPNSVGLTNLHANDVRLSWNSSYGNPDFQGAYTLYQDTTPVAYDSFTTTSHYHLISNLTPLTRYTLVGYILNYCGSGNYSDTIFFNYTFTTACPDIYNIYFTSITDTSAVANISDSTVSGFYYTCCLPLDDPDSTPSFYTTSNTVSLTNLTPGTTYYFYARHNCAQSLSSWSPDFSFTTTGVAPRYHCPQPYNTSVRSLSTTTAIADWTDSTAVSSWEIIVYPSSGNPYTEVVNYHPAYITSLDTSLSYTFYVSAICSSVERSDSTLLGYISDHPLICQALPYSPSLVSLSDSSLTLSGRRYNHHALQFAIAPYPSYTPADTLYSVIQGDTVTFSNLNPGTSYTIYIRGICYNPLTHASDTTAWLSDFFTTSAPLGSLPFSCGFESPTQNALWQFVQTQTNHFIISSAVSNSGSNSLYISYDNSSNAYNPSATSYASAYFSLDVPAGDYDYSFDWRSFGDSEYANARFLLVPASVSLDYTLWISYLSHGTLPFGTYALDNGTLYGSSTFRNVSGSLHVTSSGTYNLVATWRNLLSRGSNPPLAIDNISLTPRACNLPSAVVTSLHGSSVSIAVSSAIPGSYLLYALSTSNSAPLSYDTIPVTTSSFTLPLINLSSSTAYTLYIRNVCTNGTPTLPFTLSFTTSCGTVTAFPYVQSFESLPVGNSSASLLDPICWSTLNYGVYSSINTPNMTAVSTQHSDGSKSLELTSYRRTPLYFVLPPMGDLSLLKLDFDTRSESTSSSCGYVIAGYMTDPSDTSSFVPVTTTARSYSWTSYSALFTNAPAGSSIAFKYTDATMYQFYTYLDNIVVSQLTHAPAFYDTICANQNYTLHGFSIPSAQIPTGDTVVYRVDYSSANPTIFTSHIHRLADIYTVVYDTTVAHQPYTSGILNISDPHSYFYYATAPSRFGCDSTVELHLTVTLDSLLDTTLCEHQTLLLGDTLIADPGSYLHTFTDSLGTIVTCSLRLSVTPTLYTDTTITLTNDSIYLWQGTPYLSPGTYTRTFTSSDGCDSIVTLTLTSIFTSLDIISSLPQITIIPNPVHAGEPFTILTPNPSDILRISLFTPQAQFISTLYTNSSTINYQLSTTNSPLTLNPSPLTLHPSSLYFLLITLRTGQTLSLPLIIY